MNWKEKYLSMYQNAWKHKKEICFCNRVLTYFFYISYPILLVWTYFFHYAFILKMILVPGTSFVFVSLLRKIIARKRPYEKYEILPVIPKESSCNSMPSRHIFSATIISILYFSINSIIGLCMLVLSLLEAMIRVAGGVHYISDVVTGILLGIIFGVLTFII